MEYRAEEIERESPFQLVNVNDLGLNFDWLEHVTNSSETVAFLPTRLHLAPYKSGIVYSIDTKYHRTYEEADQYYLFKR